MCRILQHLAGDAWLCVNVVAVDVHTGVTARGCIVTIKPTPTVCICCQGFVFDVEELVVLVAQTTVVGPYVPVVLLDFAVYSTVVLWYSPSSR